MPQPEALHAETLAHLHEVDRALASHTQWLSRLNRQLICGGTPSPDDLVEDAHLRCGLGHWLHGEGGTRLHGEPGLAALQVVHQSLHGIARHLLLAQSAGQPIAPDDYDALVAVAGRIRQLLRRLEQELMERLGAVDKLTGVWNRQAVNLRLAEEVERVQRTRQPCTICFVDLDHFARINDEHGHRVGDAVLKAVAAFFAGHLRGYDTIYRLGGEEFLLCLPTTDLDQAGNLLNRLREELAATGFPVEDRTIRLTASFGVVSLDPIFFIDETLERVERAQLIARSEGGNRVCLWRDGFNSEE
ncbi:MAG: diguanylate cyclase [Pseudomonadota bacterium]